MFTDPNPDGLKLRDCNRKVIKTTEALKAAFSTLAWYSVTKHNVKVKCIMHNYDYDFSEGKNVR